ncbi:MAG: hypothetical protein HC828_06045 [Blastochloris sp.]|nr:hypothetical protein [Blastochloris sp.]
MHQQSEHTVTNHWAPEKDFLEAVEEGICADDAGDLVDHADVVVELNAIIVQARANVSRCALRERLR